MLFFTYLIILFWPPHVWSDINNITTNVSIPKSYISSANKFFAKRDEIIDNDVLPIEDNIISKSSIDMEINDDILSEDPGYNEQDEISDVNIEDILNNDEDDKLPEIDKREMLSGFEGLKEPLSFDQESTDEANFVEDGDDNNVMNKRSEIDDMEESADEEDTAYEDENENSNNDEAIEEETNIDESANKRNSVADSDFDIVGSEVEDDNQISFDDQTVEIDQNDNEYTKETDSYDYDKLLSEFDSDKDEVSSMDSERFQRDFIPLGESNNIADDPLIKEIFTESLSEDVKDSDSQNNDDIDDVFNININNQNKEEALNNENCERNKRGILEYSNIDSYSSVDATNNELHDEIDLVEDIPYENFDCSSCVNIDSKSDPETRLDSRSTISCPNQNNFESSSLDNRWGRSISRSTLLSYNSKVDYNCNEKCNKKKREEITDDLLTRLETIKLWNKILPTIKYHRVPRAGIGILIDGNIVNYVEVIRHFSLNIFLQFSRDSALLLGVYRECVNLMDIPLKVMNNPISTYYDQYLDIKSMLSDSKLGQMGERNALIGINKMATDLHDKSKLINTDLKIMILISNGILTNTGVDNMDLKETRLTLDKLGIILYVLHLGSNYDNCQYFLLTSRNRIIIAHYLNELIYGGKIFQDKIVEKENENSETRLVTGILNILTRMFLHDARQISLTKGKIVMKPGGIVGWYSDYQNETLSSSNFTDAIYPFTRNLLIDKRFVLENSIDKRQRVRRPSRITRRPRRITRRPQRIIKRPRVTALNGPIRSLSKNWYWERRFPSLKKGIIAPSNVVIMVDTMNSGFMSVIQKLVYYITILFPVTISRTSMYGLSTIKSNQICFKKSFSRTEDVQRLVTTIPESYGKTISLAQNILRVLSPTSKLISFESKNVLILIINHRVIDFASYNYVANVITATKLYVYIMGIGLADQTAVFSRLTPPNRVFTSVTRNGFFNERTFSRIANQLRADLGSSQPVIELEERIAQALSSTGRLRRPSVRRPTLRRPPVSRPTSRRPVPSRTRSTSTTSTRRRPARTSRRRQSLFSRLRRRSKRSIDYNIDDDSINNDEHIIVKRQTRFRPRIRRRPVTRRPRVTSSRRTTRRPTRLSTRRLASRARPSISRRPVLRRPAYVVRNGVVGSSNIVFLVDSTFGTKMYLIRRFITDMITQFQRESTYVTLSTFGFRYTLHSHMVQFRNTSEISRAVNRIKGVRGSVRNTGQALMETRRKLNSADPNNPLIVVVILNGPSGDDYRIPSLILREDGIKVIVMVNSRTVNDREVLRIQSSSQMSFRTNFINSPRIVNKIQPLFIAICGKRSKTQLNIGQTSLSQREASNQWTWKTFDKNFKYRRIASSQISTIVDTTSNPDRMIKMLYNIIRLFSADTYHSIRTLGLTDISAFKLAKFNQFYDNVATQLVLQTLLGNSVRYRYSTTTRRVSRVSRVSRVVRRPSTRRRTVRRRRVKRDIIDELFTEDNNINKRQRLSYQNSRTPRRPLRTTTGNADRLGYKTIDFSTDRRISRPSYTSADAVGSIPVTNRGTERINNLRSTRVSERINSPSYAVGTGTYRPRPSLSTVSTNIRGDNSGMRINRVNRVSSRIRNTAPRRESGGSIDNSNILEATPFKINDADVSDLISSVDTSSDLSSASRLASGLSSSLADSSISSLISDSAASDSSSTGSRAGASSYGSGARSSRGSSLIGSGASALSSRGRSLSSGARTLSSGGRSLSSRRRYAGGRGYRLSGRGGYYYIRSEYYTRTWYSITQRLRRIAIDMRRNWLLSTGPNKNRVVLLLLSGFPRTSRLHRRYNLGRDEGFSLAARNLTSMGIRLIIVVMQSQRTVNRYASPLLRAASTYYLHSTWNQALNSLMRFQTSCLQLLGDVGTPAYKLKYFEYRRKKLFGYAVTPLFLQILPPPYETYMTTNYLTSVQNLRSVQNYRRIVPGIQFNYLYGSINVIIAVDTSKTTNRNIIKNAIINLMRLFNRRNVRFTLISINRRSRLIIRNYYSNRLILIRNFVNRISFRTVSTKPNYGQALKLINTEVRTQRPVLRRNLVILIARDKSQDNIRYEATKLKNTGTLVSVLALGNTYNLPELQYIASSGQLLVSGEISMLPIMLYRLESALSLSLLGSRSLMSTISLKTSSYFRPQQTVFRTKNNDSPTQSITLASKNIFTSKRDIINNLQNNTIKDLENKRQNNTNNLQNESINNTINGLEMNKKNNTMNNLEYNNTNIKNQRSSIMDYGEIISNVI